MAAYTVKFGNLGIDKIKVGLRLIHGLLRLVYSCLVCDPQLPERRLR